MKILYVLSIISAIAIYPLTISTMEKLRKNISVEKNMKIGAVLVLIMYVTLLMK